MKISGKRARRVFAALFMGLLVLCMGQGSAQAAERQLTELDSSKAAQNSSYDRAIFSEARNGIYFLKPASNVYSSQQSYDIIFYNLAANTYQTVYSYQDAEAVYSSQEAVWFMKSASAWNSGENKACYDITVTKYDFSSGIASETKLESIYSDSHWSVYGRVLGVDQKGRIYLGTQENELCLFAPEGKLLDKISFPGTLDCFYGFDAVNGNFYYCGSYNWEYWGFTHDMASLMAGNIDGNNKIKITGQNLAILYQRGFFEHTGSAAMLNQRYLAVLSTFSNELLTLVDSNSYDYRDYTEQSTSINVVDSSVSVSPFNVSNGNVIKLAAYTAASEYVNCWDVSSAGTRCVLTKDGSSLVINSDKCTLTAYDIASKKKGVRTATSHPVYDMAMFGNTCVVLEKENGRYYVETIDWTLPSDFSAAVPSAMNVGDSSIIQCSAGDSLLLDYTFESSNPKVADVDEKGRINAWKAGTAVITVKAPLLNKAKTFTVTVKDKTAGKDAFSVVYTKGISSTTIHEPGSDGYYGTVITANLNQKPDGGFERVEYVNSKVLIETYSSSLALKSKKYLSCELPLFGGYYSGGQYNFLVFGQGNHKEKDSVEVIRVVKYDKNWKRLGACSIKGANTYEPFEAGGLSMTEAGGMLYVHTCHKMYASKDGVNHQANCIFKVQESDMTLQDSYYDVMNISKGYVSHSFMQWIDTDGEYIYRADLGDAYPRGIALTATRLTDKVNKPEKYGTIVEIPGTTGDNYTGFTLSGLKLSEDNYIVAGTGISKTSDKARNVWVSASGKAEWKENTNWITKYSASGNISAETTKLVKLNGNQFLLMWEEHNSKKKTYVTKMALLNPEGKLASDIYQMPLALSACEPIVTASGNVLWYVTDNGSPAFISINPYHLEDAAAQSKNFQLFKDTTGTQGAQTVNYKNIKYKVTGSSKVTATGPVKKSITKVTLPASIKVSGKTYKVTAIGKNAFSGCKKLTNVTIGSNVTKIGQKAFYQCTALKKAVIGKNVSSIGKMAFSGCKKLKTVTVKTSKLKSGKVGANVFKGIHAKAVVKVPKSKYKLYKAILKKKGLPSGAKVKKS